MVSARIAQKNYIRNHIISDAANLRWRKKEYIVQWEKEGKMTKRILSKKILFHEIFGFGVVIIVLWLNEILDIPHRLFGAEKTPVNITESIFETILVFILAIGVIYFIKKLLRKIKYLEGFLKVCSVCKRINIEDDWIPIEVYISDKSEAKFTHGLCPECIAEIYGSESNKKKNGSSPDLVGILL